MLSNSYHCIRSISARNLRFMVALAVLAILMCPDPTKGAEPKLTPVPNRGEILIASLEYTDDDMPQMPESRCHWYWIPSWFAGTWHRETITTLAEYDYKRLTERNCRSRETAKSDDDEGWQKDSRGECWNCDHTPFRSESTGEQFKQVFVVTAVHPLEVTEDRVVKEFLGTGLLIDKVTGITRYTARAKSIQTYRPVKPGLISTDSVTTEFDENGNAVRVSKTHNLFRQTAAFSARDLHSGRDMRAAFREFLISEGMSDRVPTELTALPLPLEEAALH